MMVSIGDELAFRMSRHGDEWWEIRKVTKITPTGQIVISDGDVRLNPDLSVKGQDVWSSWPNEAAPITEEIRKKVWRRKIIKKLDDFSWEDLETKKLQDVLKCIRPSKSA